MADRIPGPIEQATINYGRQNGQAREDRGDAWEPKLVEEGTPEDSRRITICAADVVPLEVDWLMQDRLPFNFVTVFAGRTGVGKSFVTCDLAARISQGGPVPLTTTDEHFPRGNCLFISEDPYEYMLVPRLIESGADMNRCHFLLWEELANYHLSDVVMLEQAFQEAGNPLLVAIDPPTNFLHGADEHRNAEIRQVLSGVVNWAKKHRCCLLLITHVNKASGKTLDAINRVLGSVAWVSTPRMAHTFASDPDDRSLGLWVPMKTQLGPMPKGLTYRILKSGKCARVEWVGEVDTTADEAMAGEKKPPPRAVAAAEWLIDRFRERCEWDSEDLFRAAKACGISRDAVFEAKTTLALPKARKLTDQDGDRWVWWVPLDWPQLSHANDACPSATVAPVEKQPSTEATVADPFDSLKPLP